MEFKINGKSLLLIMTLSAGAVFAQYTSKGGVIVEGATEEEIKAAILETMPVGSVTFRMDSVNPTTIYGGTWELMTGDAVLKFGDGSAQTGIVSGNNTKNVPLPQHSHDMNHTHQRGSMEVHGDLSAPGYGNTSVGYSLDGSGAFHPSGSKTYLDKIDGGANQGSVYRSVNFYASRTWTGHTSRPYVSNTGTAKDNTGSAGTAVATVDVEGSTIKMNVWKRKG